MENIEFVAFERAPATESFDHSNRTFTPTQLNIIGAALNAGVFYQDAMRDHCRDAWMAECPAVDVRLTGDDGSGYELLPTDFLPKRDRINEVRKAVGESPRGTWALLGNPWTHDDGRQMRRLEMYMSVGDGEAYSVQCNRFSDAAKSLPGYKEALEEMIDMDIYLARQAETERFARSMSQHFIKLRGLREGMVLREVELAGVKYSTATITSVSPNGYLKLFLTKRGSKRRWEWTGLAQAIKGEQLQDPAPMRDLLAAA